MVGGHKECFVCARAGRNAIQLGERSLLSGLQRVDGISAGDTCVGVWVHCEQQGHQRSQGSWLHHVLVPLFTQRGVAGRLEGRC